MILAPVNLEGSNMASFVSKGTQYKGPDNRWADLGASLASGIQKRMDIKEESRLLKEQEDRDFAKEKELLGLKQDTMLPHALIQSGNYLLAKEGEKGAIEIGGVWLKQKTSGEGLDSKQRVDAEKAAAATADKAMKGYEGDDYAGAYAKSKANALFNLTGAKSFFGNYSSLDLNKQASILEINYPGKVIASVDGEMGYWDPGELDAHKGKKIQRYGGAAYTAPKMPAPPKGVMKKFTEGAKDVGATPLEWGAGGGMTLAALAALAKTNPTLLPAIGNMIKSTFTGKVSGNITGALGVGKAAGSMANVLGRGSLAWQGTNLAGKGLGAVADWVTPKAVDDWTAQQVYNNPQIMAGMRELTTSPIDLFSSAGRKSTGQSIVNTMKNIGEYKNFFTPEFNPDKYPTNRWNIEQGLPNRYDPGYDDAFRAIVDSGGFK